MPDFRERDHRPLWIAIILISICATACWVAFSRIQATRHELVQRRLRTAVDIVRERAAAAIKSPDALPVFVEDMRSWANVTGLRITLIMPDGSVLADTELPEMPNIIDRPEVRAASEGHTRMEFRRSALTGKETLYVATPIVDGDVRIGILRAATSSGEIDGVLAGFEYVFAVIAVCCLGTGVLVGLAFSRRDPAKDAEIESAPEREHEIAA